MPRNGTWEARNAEHRVNQAATWNAAASDKERLTAAFDMFRSAAKLLGRRRPPPGVPKNAHQEVSARLVRETAGYLKSLAEAIDRGDHDIRRT